MLNIRPNTIKRRRKSKGKTGEGSNKQIGDGFGLDKRTNSIKSCNRVGFKNLFFKSEVTDLMI